MRDKADRTMLGVLAAVLFVVGVSSGRWIVDGMSGQWEGVPSLVVETNVANDAFAFFHTYTNAVYVSDAGGSCPDAWGLYLPGLGSSDASLLYNGQGWTYRVDYGDVVAPDYFSGYHTIPYPASLNLPCLLQGTSLFHTVNPSASGSVWVAWASSTNLPVPQLLSGVGNTSGGFRMLQDLDMWGHSIHNIGLDSLSFSNGVRISANARGLLVNGSAVVSRTNLVSSQSAELSYPVFCLPIGDAWVDYILKASTNNFTNLCYYVRSTATNQYTTDSDVWAYFTDDYSPDIRAWHYSPPGVSIYSQLASPANSRVSFVMVYPSHDALGWTNWMSSTNTSLIWSYARCDAISIEMNQTGNKEHWNPCVPVSWQSQRTRP